MGTFDIRQDAPGLLRAESLNITLKFDRTGPTTGRVSWNIPAPAAGCTAETQAYNGMLVTLDTTQTAVDKLPTNGAIYSADATADANLFAGDKIGTSLVIGAFYGDKTTTFFDVSGLKANTAYYVSGFPVDTQYRYYIEGVHAYSLELKNKGTNGTNGTQVVVMNPYNQTMGIRPTDATGLNPALTYDFTVQVGLDPQPQSMADSVDFKPTAPRYHIVIAGNKASTFQDLTNEINKQLALVNNVAQSPTAPNTGSLYWNATTQTLYVWDGSTNNIVANLIVQESQPNAMTSGTYWLNTTTGILSVYNGAPWATAQTITLPTNPMTPVADQTYWFDGTTGYLWGGATWCGELTYVQATDPSLPLNPPPGAFWLNTTNNVLNRWNETFSMWNPATVIESDVDPNAIPAGTYWFNTATNALYAYNMPSVGWNLQSNVAISETAPSTPVAGKLWYVPSLTELFQRDITNTTWVRKDVIAFAADPTQRNYCDLWWNTTSGRLYVWDKIHGVWVAAPVVYQQGIDPTTATTLAEGTLWYNTITGQLYVWHNQCFNVVPFINYPTDPVTTLANGVVWHNTTTNTWYLKEVSGWVLITPIQSTLDPSSLPAGTFWVMPSTGALQMWNGIMWTSVMYTMSPVTPSTGALWFNSATNTLMTWNGSQWIAATPTATCMIDSNGNLIFIDSAVGSSSFIGLTNGTLFSSLTTQNIFHDAKPGVDGASDTPSYNEVGIGTDGTPDQRLELANEIRYELGYPVVDVELTPQQIDYALTKALNEIRARSSAAYTRGFFFMRINPEQQIYFLTNKISGMNKIVDVLGVYRLTSSFMSSAHGAGVYGQIILQQLYNMGTFDLLSYHIMSEYTKLMEILFAARITFTWDEAQRRLHILHRFSMSEEAVAIEAAVERTEQDILTDRILRPWIRRYTLATCRLMLAETRGKFASLPGAGGAVTLNATELRMAAAQEIELCIAEIQDYIADTPEEWSRSDIIFG